MTFELDDRVAIVTGALGLLGREHCRALAEAGARVVVTDRDLEGCQSFAEELANASGRDTLAVAADVTDPDSVRTLKDRTLERFGQVDVLVNNAAMNDRVESPDQALEASKFENFPLELWKRVLDVNVTGTFLTCQIVGAEMARRGSGSIINIASTYGIVAPDQKLYRDAEGEQRFFKSPAYPTSKAAVIQLSRFLAAYWGEQGVRTNVLSPGGVENGQPEYFVERYGRRTSLGRMADKTDYHGPIVFLASDASAYMNGANLVVDGGWTAW